MKIKTSSGELGTVLTLTSENDEEVQTLKALWDREAELSSFEVKEDGNIEVEIATTD